MIGLCVEEYAHLPQNTSDLVGIAMRLLGKARERIEIFLVVRRVAKRGGKTARACDISAFDVCVSV